MKLLIVDDEVIIRDGLRQVIDWKEMGITLIAAAESAEEGIKIIESERPDILMTDIQMTGQSGLELSNWVRTKYPDMEIIILSGYDEFSYAQEALRQGIGEFLLKTSGPEEISKAVLMAKHKLIQKRKLNTETNIQKNVFRNQWFDRLLLEGINLDQWANEVSSSFPILNEAHSAEQSFRTMIFTASGWGTDAFDRNLLLFAVENILNELLHCETLLHKDQIVIIDVIKFGNSDMSSIQYASEIIEKQLKCAAFTSIGPTVDHITKIHKSYELAKYTFSFKDLPRTKKLLNYESVRVRKGSRTVCTVVEERELAELLHRGDIGPLRNWIKLLIHRELSDPQITPTSINEFLNSVVLSGHRWLERVVGASEYERIVLERLSNKSFDLSISLEDQMQQRLQSFALNYHGAASGTPISTVQRSKAYIRENLHKNLSLKEVSDWVHWNPNHFSEMFKREEGITYIEFVKRERMEKAIRIINETPAKISEVAHEVGYEDVKYFSQLFKKYTGKTPSEYRK